MLVLYLNVNLIDFINLNYSRNVLFLNEVLTHIYPWDTSQITTQRQSLHQRDARIANTFVQTDWSIIKARFNGRRYARLL